MELRSLETLPEFDDHRFITVLHDPVTNLKGFIVIHRGGLSAPSFGATRLWEYAEDTLALRDALKLSRTMSYKSALAGLPYGGAKAVIIKQKNSSTPKRDLLKAYTNRVNYLSGKFITGTDMGIDQEDLLYMRSQSPFFVGHSIDPTYWTGLGLVMALRPCLKEVFGTESLEGRSLAILGLGKIGSDFLRRTYAQAEKIYVADLDEEKIQRTVKEFPGVIPVTGEEIYHQEVDIFSPCGSSNALSEKTIAALRCKIILGGANNQLDSEDISAKLFDKKILYAPDYVVNAGGLMSVVHEFEEQRKHRSVRPSELTRRIEKIGDTMTDILTESRAKNASPHAISTRRAQSILETYI